MTRVAALVSVVLVASCSDRILPAQPSSPATIAAQLMSLEAESGTGDGSTMQRPRASGGLTIHLAPGERRQWTFFVDAVQAQYAIAVTYSNDNIGETETIHLSLDGVSLDAFDARDTGDDGEGWNVFATDLAGNSSLGRGSHALVLSVTGGDGCVEIDRVTLSPVP